MKFIVLKKGALIALATILCLGVAIGICCGAAAATTASTTSVREKVVVIDAGHGGMDAGVYGINTKTKESDINLALAKQLKGYFANAGFKVVMTRKTNAGLYGAPTKGFKMRDMKKRKQIIEAARIWLFPYTRIFALSPRSAAEPYSSINRAKAAQSLRSAFRRS